MKKMNRIDIKEVIKNESGVTMIALVIMIVIMLILAGVSLYVGGTSMQDIVERQDQSTLNMIQEIVISQYAKAHTLEQTGVLLSETIVQPKMYYGTCIKTEELYDSITRPTGGTVFADTAVYMASIETYDDCYYRLSGTDLRNLGIADSSENNTGVHSYIVKYSTGEVYDETLAETKYYLKGNRNMQSLVENTIKNVETTDFTE